MFKRPSSRRKSGTEGVQLNLVPILDTMVTLIGFMLYTMSFLAIVSIQSPLPQASQKDVEEKLKEKPLQLTVTLREGEAEIWSPFDKIKAKTIAYTSPGQPDVKALHEALLEVKREFPAETKVVVVPFGGATYDVLINVMDSMRGVDASDPPIYFHNDKTNADEVVKTLFPDVIFGNLLGDA
jgi:biopolymer transport protein ExbD